MTSGNEIQALIRLIDDPDDEVFSTVAAKLLDYGKEIIPKLEQLWEVTVDESLQERIEMLIHRVHFQDLQDEFLKWSKSRRPELLRGAILIAKYHFPDLNIPALLSQFDQIRRNIWLELNNYLTPLEQVNVINSILFNYYKLQGNELTKREPQHFFINNLLEGRQGNSFSLGIIYLALCELLDIPVFAVKVPRQFIFAYIDTLQHFFPRDEEDTPQQLQFFIDPINGMVYTQTDVDAYLRKINAPRKSQEYVVPMTTVEIIVRMLEELKLCYQYKREDTKAEEIGQLIQLLSTGKL